MRNKNFINESTGLSPEELYAQLREYFPKERTHYGLLKKYITEKYETYSYELQLCGIKGISDLTAGYILAFREMLGLIEMCDSQLCAKLKMKGDA